jgi:preprotein translocase subunit Sss1
MDIWQQIKRREAEMNAEDKVEAEREKIAEIQRKRQMQEYRDIGLAVAIAAVAMGAVGWLVVQIIS